MKTKRTKSPRLIWLVVIVATTGAVVIGYLIQRSNGGNTQTVANKDAKTAQTAEIPTTKEATTGTVIKTGDSQYGPMLFDSRGQAIYIWQLEGSSTPECYGDCAEEWPPVLTKGAPVASGDVSSVLLGTTTRTDGTTQVTYNGHPLYFYAHEGPGEVECHNIKTHGGLWWVIQPSGTRAQ